MIKVIIIILIIVFIIWTIVRRARRFDARTSALSPETDLAKLDQDERNRKYISAIIFNSERYPPKRARKSLKAFEAWQKFQSVLFYKPSKKICDQLTKYHDRKASRLFMPQYTATSPYIDKRYSKKSFSLFLKNIFTEPFPSLHDMDDWFATNLINEIMILHGISLEDSVNYVFFQKRYYVNHEMTEAIIQYDIFKLHA